MDATASDARRNRPLLGIALIVGAVFLMSFQDAVIKLASPGLPLWQIYVLRGLFAVPALGAAALTAGSPGLWRRALGRWPLARAGLLTLMYVALYASLPVLDLATVAAAFYTGPLFITLFSALLIGEPVRQRGWLAIALGFAGVLVILRPGSDAFSPLALLPVLSGLFYALAAIATRSRCAEEAPLALALSLNLVLLASGLLAGFAIALWQPAANGSTVAPFLLGGWVTPGAAAWSTVALLAALIVGIGLTLAAAYQSAPPVVIATFDYSYLVFAALWSYVLFDSPPDGPTLAGMAMIAGAGLMVTRR